MPKTSKPRKQAVAKKKSPPKVIIAEGKSSPKLSRGLIFRDLIEVEDKHDFIAKASKSFRAPNIPDRALRGGLDPSSGQPPKQALTKNEFLSQQGVQFKWNDDRSTSAEPCATTATQVQYTYRELYPDFHQARTFVIQCATDDTPPKIDQLRKHLKGTQLSTVADDRDLNKLIVRCTGLDKGPMTAKALTRSFIGDKTRLTAKTLKSYFSRVEKEPQAKKS